MARKVDEFVFHIQAYSPETIPMGRLAEYMADLAKLLGEPASVHFVKLRPGSTAIVHRVDSEAIPKVRFRARSVNSGDAPADLKVAAQALKARLRSDNARGARLIDPDGDKILEFKIPELNAVEYPSVSEQGIIQGQVVRLGGAGDWVPVHLEDIDGQTYICEAKKEKTKELAAFYLNGLIRAKGTGRWSRKDDGGGWDLDNFRIHDFSPVASESLLESVERFRAIPGKWKEMDDPLAALDEIRHGVTTVKNARSF